jgi:hypothetical protein
MSDMKHDHGKARFDLLIPEFTEQMAQVMELGTRKYAENSWQHVPNGIHRYTAALHRHLNAWQQGEAIDKESGLSHMAHVAINAMFLYKLHDGQGSDPELDFGGDDE